MNEVMKKLQSLSMPTPDYTKLNKNNNYSNNPENVGLGVALNMAHQNQNQNQHGGQNRPNEQANGSLDESSVYEHNANTNTTTTTNASNLASRTAPPSRPLSHVSGMSLISTTSHSHTIHNQPPQSLLDKLRSIRLPSKEAYLTTNALLLAGEGKRANEEEEMKYRMEYGPVYEQQRKTDLIALGFKDGVIPASAPGTPAEDFNFQEWSASPPGKRPTFFLNPNENKKHQQQQQIQETETELDIRAPTPMDPRLIMGLPSSSEMQYNRERSLSPEAKGELSERTPKLIILL